MFKKTLQIVIVLAIVIIPVNDLGRYISAQYQVGNATQDVVQKAAETAQRTKGTREQVGSLMVPEAQKEGVELYAYDQDISTVTVYCRKAVEGTILAARLIAWKNEQPPGTPLYVKSHAKRPMR